tara:strand:- start:366 stop:827 length:462 start_codon:yes stop_codon:yes gene_type:complete
MELYELFSIAECLVVIGVVLLVVEVLFFGFSTFFLLFIGFSCMVTGLLMSVSLIPESTVSALSSVSIFSIISAVGLWKQLKKLQTPMDNSELEVGLVGHKFELNSDLSPSKPLKYRYSGVDWVVKSSEAIKSGQTVKVINLDVGVLLVTKDEQ